jgi:hypothetical protein
MKYNFLFIIVPLILIVLNYGCDKIEGPYTEEFEVEEITGDTVPSVVFFEFTGVRCMFCPQGHEVIHGIDTLYKEQFHAIGIHAESAGSFTVPFEDHPESDFTTEVSDQLYNLLKPGTSLPVGAAQSLNTENVKGRFDWNAEVAKNIVPSSKIKSFIRVGKEDIDSVNIKVEYVVTFDTVFEGKYKFCAYVLENGIVAPQIYLGKTIEDYHHEHVLRASLTNDLGNDIDENPEVGKEYSFELEMKTSPKWNADSLHIVPFIYNSDTKNMPAQAIIKESKENSNL